MTTVFITLPNTKIELLEPLGENSPIAKFLERNPDGGIHHVCYEVDDIRAARDALKAAGARVLGDGEPNIGAHGKPVLFLHPKDFSGTLVELEAERRKWTRSCRTTAASRSFSDLVDRAVRGAAVGRSQSARRAARSFRAPIPARPAIPDCVASLFGRPASSTLIFAVCLRRLRKPPGHCSMAVLAAPGTSLAIRMGRQMSGQWQKKSRAKALPENLV